jgi:uncharacterized protein YbaR (Trm112 family)
VHILLTDILACPVCGPPFGLIVRSDDMRDRRVLEGALGCPNCERTYPVRGGVAMLDPEDDRMPDDTVAAGSGGDDQATIRIAALLGLNDASGFALVAGPAAAFAADLAELGGTVEIIADATYTTSGAASRLRLGARLPFYDGKLHGVWLSGESADAWLEEGARALHPLGRLVIEGSPSLMVQRLAAAGLRIVAEQGGTALATKV